MSISKRLFIGNVHPDVTDADLRERFSNFGTVHQVELRSKSDDHFAFMNMVFEDIHAMRKCVDTLNNTRWKGLTLKVQYAKQSFLEKLKQEREQGQRTQSGGTNASSAQQSLSTNGYNRNLFHRDKPKPRRPDNFDFEIVSGDANGNADVDQSNERGKNLKMNKVREEKPSMLENKPTGLKEHDDPVAVFKNVSPEVIQDESTIARELKSSKNKQKHPASDPIENMEKVKKRAVSDSEDEDEKDGIPRFRGLASFGDSIFSFSPAEPECVEIKESISNASIPLAPIPSENPISDPPQFQLKLNPRKKAKSDELRIKSLLSREEQAAQRSKAIQLALAKVKPPSVKDSSDDTSKPSSKPALFAEDNEDNGEELLINIKPQYEGVSGQKILKLKSKFGDDKRFQMDERFAESAGDPSAVGNSEKDVQLGILEEVVGPTAPVSKPVVQSAPEDLRFLRFDPTLPAHQKLILNRDKVLPKENEETVKTTKEKESNKIESKKKRKGQEQAIEEEKAKLRDPTAKATFKVADNLKKLFAKEPEATSSFSILKKFRSTPENDCTQELKKNNNEEENSKPRSDWKKNPFKYDSSDDEDEGNGKSKKKHERTLSTVPTPSTPNNVVPAQHSFFKKESFFYTPKDDRLKGIFEQFLSTKEDPEEVAKEFNESGRIELKAIAKTKMKNSKRKSEKKVKIMRLIRKKKQRDAVQRQKKYEERKAAGAASGKV